MLQMETLFRLLSVLRPVLEMLIKMLAFFSSTDFLQKDL